MHRRTNINDYAILISALLALAFLASNIMIASKLCSLRTDASETLEAVRTLSDGMAEIEDQIEALKDYNTQQDERMDELKEELQFEPWDIPLAPVLQEHTCNRCRAASLDPALVFAIMEKESQFDVDAVGYNSNGTQDAGLMQVNSVHWNRLEAMGIDVHSPEGGIDAGMYLLLELLEKYPEQDALAAYNVGETEMHRGGGRAYAESIGLMRSHGMIG